MDTPIAAPNTNTHRPFLALFLPADWRAALSFFSRALAASRSSSDNGARTVGPMRLALRLQATGEKVLVCFAPTDEEGTILCTIAGRGEAPPRG